MIILATGLMFKGEEVVKFVIAIEIEVGRITST